MTIKKFNNCTLTMNDITMVYVKQIKGDFTYYTDIPSIVIYHRTKLTIDYRCT